MSTAAAFPVAPCSLRRCNPPPHGVCMLWSREENDALLAAAIADGWTVVFGGDARGPSSAQGPRAPKADGSWAPDWAAISAVVGSRNKKQCRERWFNFVDPGIDISPLSPPEESELIRLATVHEQRWSEIAALMSSARGRRPALFLRNNWTRVIGDKASCKKVITRMCASQSSAGHPVKEQPRRVLMANLLLHDSVSGMTSETMLGMVAHFGARAANLAHMPLVVAEPFMADAPALHNANAMVGAVVLVGRGVIPFTNKARKVQACGASAIIFVNTSDDGFCPTGTDDASVEDITIPALVRSEA